MAEREWPSGDRQAPSVRDWWTGDVWRFAVLLKRQRPDLRITAVDAVPTGLVLVTNLDPNSDHLRKNYAEMVTEMQRMSLPEMTIEKLRAELGMESTSALGSFEDISSRFWL